MVVVLRAVCANASGRSNGAEPSWTKVPVPDRRLEKNLRFGLIISHHRVVMLESATLFNMSCSEVSCCRAEGLGPPAETDQHNPLDIVSLIPLLEMN